MDKFVRCSFRDCGAVLSKKELCQPKINHNKVDYCFCQKHFHKMLGLVAEHKKTEDRINKNLIN